MTPLIALSGLLALVLTILFLIIALFFAIKKNPKWKNCIAGMFACFASFLVIVFNFPQETSQEPNNPPISNYTASTKDEPTTAKSEVTPIVTPQKTTPPSLMQYADKLYPIYESSKKEFQLIAGFKGGTEGIKQNHFEVQDQLNALRIGDRRYTNHTAIHSSLIEAHGYLVSLWQAYEDRNEKQIADFTKLASDSFTQFENLSQKIKDGQIKDEYAND